MSHQNHIFKKIRKGSQAEALADLLSDRPDSSNARVMSTIGAIAERGLGLKVSCTACGNEEKISSDALAARFGATTELKKVHPACASCGSSAVSSLPY